MEKATLKTLCLCLLLLSTTAFSQRGNNIIGHVRYHDKAPMPGVVAYLHNTNGQIIDTANGNPSGMYIFHNVAPGSYNVTFTTQEAAGGIDLTDAFLVMLHLMNQYPFTPIQELASDVNGDGNVDWSDYNAILAYLNQGIPFPVGPWVFEPLGFTVPSADREGFTTRGGSSGDVNGSLVPDPKNNSIFLENPTISMTTSPSDPIRFKLSGIENTTIGGLHLVIDIPEGLTVTNVESVIPDLQVSKEMNQVRITWIDVTRRGFEIENGRPLLVIYTKAAFPSRDGNIYSLHLNDQSHFIDIDGESLRGVPLTLPTIQTNTIEDLAVDVYPNPFRESTRVSCQLPQDGKVVISLFDQAGRKVREISDGNCSAGNYQAEIDGSNLMPGIYHYTVVYSSNNQFINSGTIIKSK